MQKQLDLTLYLVLDPVLCGGIAGLVETTRIAVANGVTTVQLRSEQPFDRKDWYNAALALKKVLSTTPVPLLINDQVDIAMAVQADGVHVGQSDLPVEVVRQLIGSEKIVGLSVSNQAQMQAVPWSQIDYLGIGPIFPTSSKGDAAPV
ncbi:MAG: thiamine phosphate synthase, partial [Snodgrassella alvi]|nr:thiamine phosphate synthase [Snodgrassella alvi]